MSKKQYQPPYTINSKILALVEQIGELIGVLKLTTEQTVVPHLRKTNQIKTIQASLQIEGNTLSLEQVTDVLEGKRVLGQPREIQEVKNTFDAYDKMPDFSPHKSEDILNAHFMLMQGLVDQCGIFRKSDVGIKRGDRVVHIAPPSVKVAELMDNLLHWFKQTEEHPLIAGCVFHYELEFIHPFEDGNGRVGRLWQTLILSKWQPVFAVLPVESIIRDRQELYYSTLRESDKNGNSTLFIEFMLDAIYSALKDFAADTEQVAEQVAVQVEKLINALINKELSTKEAMTEVGISHRPTFRDNYLLPAIELGFVEMTNPASPTSKNQKYRLTSKGKNYYSKVK